MITLRVLPSHQSALILILLVHGFGRDGKSSESTAIQQDAFEVV